MEQRRVWETLNSYCNRWREAVASDGGTECGWDGGSQKEPGSHPPVSFESLPLAKRGCETQCGSWGAGKGALRHRAFRSASQGQSQRQVGT